MSKPSNNRAWLLVLPVVLIVAFSAVVPLMTVVNYSVQDILGPEQRVFVGPEWYKKVLRDPELHGAFARQLLFSAAVLAVEVPLGIAIALGMPLAGFSSSLCLVLLALPLLIPWNVVGTVWQVFARSDIGLGGRAINALGIHYNYTADALDAWFTVLAMDVWHWTPLIALLLRFMDSFMIYTEPFVLTGGGPGNATTFLTQYLTRLAIGQFDLGPAAAFSIVYFLVVLLFSYLFYTAMTREES